MNPTHYRITVRGRLSTALRAAFDGLTVEPSAGDTAISGEIDQPALFGVLACIETLGLELLEVRRVTAAR